MKQFVPGRLHVMAGTGLHVVCVSAEQPRYEPAHDLGRTGGKTRFMRQRVTVLAFYASPGKARNPTFEVWELDPSIWRLV